MLISEHCNAKVTALLDKLNTNLNDFVMHFNEMRQEGHLPLALDSRQLSHMSDKEEEKVPGDLARLMGTSSLAGSKSKGP